MFNTMIIIIMYFQ